MHKCANQLCKNLTSNPKFCSKSCAAIVNNQKFPKRTKHKKRYYCRVCNIEVPARRTLCDKHNPQKIDWSKVTINDIIYKYDQGYGASNKYTRIRDVAQTIYKNSTRPKKCEQCGYDKHYHVCHIKPIHLFDLETSISIVNNLDNLISLCPNCHWELDNGLIHLDIAPARYRT